MAVTRVTGRFTFAELANHLHRLVRDREFQADFDSMIVAMDAAAVPRPSAIGTLAPLVRTWSSRRRGSRWALVLPTPEARGFAERALKEIQLNEITARCFCDETEALDWLEGARGVGKVRSAAR